MCLVLEKTRECKMEVMTDGKLRTEATFSEGGDAQRNMCNALKGVHLHLIRDEEKGIICPENKHHGSKMDLGHACHKVMDELMLHNDLCEAKHENEGWGTWALSLGQVWKLVGLLQVVEPFHPSAVASCRQVIPVQG